MNKKLFVVAHNIRSAHNVGAIFRTADGAGVRKVYLTGYTPCPHSLSGNAESGSSVLAASPELTKAKKMIEKTALGAEAFVEWERVQDIGELLKKLRKKNIKIVALEQDKRAIDYKKFKPVFPMALVLGNEVGGVEKEILDACDEAIFIPMQGKKESLNVSVAAGIAMYELLS